MLESFESYAVWYVLSRFLFFVCRNVYVYWFGPVNYTTAADADTAGIVKAALYLPFIGDVIIAGVFVIGSLIVALTIIVSPALLADAIDKKVEEVSEKRQLRLKESDKVGLLSEVEK